MVRKAVMMLVVVFLVLLSSFSVVAANSTNCSGFWGSVSCCQSKIALYNLENCKKDASIRAISSDPEFSSKIQILWGSGRVVI